MDPSTTDFDDTFTPPGEPWLRVSPVLATVYRLELALAVGVVLVAVPFLLLIPRFPVWVVLALEAVALVALAWGWWLFGRRVRSWGYAERADDLLVTSGILFRRLVIVPYGRMQLVDLTAGPVHRMFRITTVQLHTAAATTDASIPGLRPDVAAGLRDRLARLGEQRSAGL